MLLVLCIVMASSTPFFMTGRNLTNLGFQSAAVICLALGQLLVILTRGIDISVGSIVGLVVACGSVLYSHHIPAIPTILVMLAIGAMVGAVNGLLLIKGKLPHPFIATLAMLGIVRGIAFIMTSGNILPGQPPFLLALGNSQLWSIPYPTILVALLVLMTWVLTKRMLWGRWLYAIGGNPEGAMRVGIPVNQVLLSVYVLSGLFAAVAGAIVAGQIGVGDASAGLMYEMNAIAAVMIGGVSYLGGRGGVSNAVIGALTVTVITNGLQLLNVSGHWQQIAIGAVILAAVELNVVRAHFEARFRMLQAAAGEVSGASQ